MKNKALLFALRDCTSVMRSTSALVLLVFSWVLYSPAVFALYTTGVDQPKPEDTFAPKAQVFMESLSEFQDIVVTQYKDLKALDSGENFKGSGTKLTKGSDFYQALNDLQATTLEQEIALREHWPTLAKTYPDYESYSEILKEKLTTLENERKQTMQKQMVRVQYAFNTARSSVNLETSKAIKTLAQSLKTLEKLNPEQAKHSWDNEQLPFGTLPSAARKPSDSQNQLLENLGLKATKNFADTNNSMMRSLSSVSANAGVSVSADAGNAENLAEGIEIQFSDEIKTKVEELNYDPVQIYNWVYNNIKFIPSYGSLQGAAQAFDLKAGNATDTASILISMLRYAGIEAKYKIGTVEVDVDKARNWVGGVDYAESVQVLLGQGGIPNALMIYEGETKGIKLEHTWVEAYVNDTWVSLDPSFKQYEFTEGVDLESAVPFDGTDLASQLESGLTSNEAEGWVQGVDQTAIETAMTSYQQSLETFINDNHADDTVWDILGGQAIIEIQALELPSELPFQKIIAEVSAVVLPESMRHKFKYELQFTNLKLEDYTANLAGKALAVSFKPATKADEQLLLDYLPDTIESESDIPSSLPYGLFNVIAEFTVDDEVVSTSSLMRFGTELQNNLGFYSPRFGWETTSNPVVAADYQAVAMDLQGVTIAQLSELRNRMEASKDTVDQLKELTPENALQSTLFESLNKHRLTGDILQSGTLLYMAMTNFQSEIIAKSTGVIQYREPSYGTFSTSASLSYFFLQPQNVNFGAVVMDMDRMSNSSECKANCWNKWEEFNKRSGAMMSAYEHIIPEQLFSREDQRVVGVSAVKAISMASALGQKIYTLDKSNYSLASSQIQFHSTEMRNEISSAISEGKVVTVHESPISQSGWQGMGYIILDQETGAGAYKISTGANGGFVLILSGLLIMLTAFAFLVPLLATGVGLTFFAMALVVASSLVAAGVSAIMGNTAACNGFLTLALATIGFMMSMLIPQGAPVILHYLASVLGVGGVAGNLMFGSLC